MSEYPNKHKYKYLEYLRQVGVAARLNNGKLQLGPQEKITKEVLDGIEQFKVQIIAELEDLNVSTAECDYALHKFATKDDRYASNLHNLDEAEKAWIRCFGFASTLYHTYKKDQPETSITPVWMGEGSARPPRPYYYVHDNLVDNQYTYSVMYADVDGHDYLVLDNLEEGKNVE